MMNTGASTQTEDWHGQTNVKLNTIALKSAGEINGRLSGRTGCIVRSLGMH